MRTFVMSLVGIGLVVFGLSACGSSPTKPYDKYTVEPDSVSASGARYYTYALHVPGYTYNAVFSTEGGRWNWRAVVGSSWQVAKPEILLYTTEGYTNAGATKFIEEMGHEIVVWQSNGNPDYYTVKLDKDATDELPDSVPLISIFEAYAAEATLFSGAFPR